MKINLYNPIEGIELVQIFKDSLYINGEFYGTIISRADGITAVKTSRMIDDSPDCLTFIPKLIKKTPLIIKVEKATGVQLEEVRAEVRLGGRKLYFAILYAYFCTDKLDEIAEVLGKGSGAPAIIPLRKAFPKVSKNKEFKEILKLFKN